jgi:hypothetical protein
MKKRPSKKLSINKEAIRRLSAAELSAVQGGVEPPNTGIEPAGTVRECSA